MSKTRAKQRSEAFASAVQRYCRLRGYPPPTVEHPFAPGRRFRFDLAWPPVRVALECEGGLFGRGERCRACGQTKRAGHGAAGRVKSDMEKYNLAGVLGWRVFRALPQWVGDKRVFYLVDAIFGGKR